MAPYLGEIRMFAGSFAPAEWMFCAGQVLLISEYSDLYSLIGTAYGGDGQSTFALPDLRGRAPMHVGNGHQLAESGGSERVTLTGGQIPVHGYPAEDVDATSNVAGVLARGGSYVEGPADGHVVGRSQPHENRSPFLGINYIISVNGIFPSQ